MTDSVGDGAGVVGVADVALGDGEAEVVLGVALGVALGEALVPESLDPPHAAKLSALAAVSATRAMILFGYFM